MSAAVVLDTLTIVGTRAHGYDAVIIEHPLAAAYCLPGRRHRIVLTSAALRTLRPAELGAVLAHERAHVRGRHHLALVGARAAAAAFPHIRLFRAAACEIARLLELLADDAAARGTDPYTVASALLRVAAGRAPAATLAANGAEVAKRVHRLLSPRRPLGGSHRLVLTSLSAVAILGPIAVALLPVLAVLTGRYAHVCPVPNL